MPLAYVLDEHLRPRRHGEDRGRAGRVPARRRRDPGLEMTPAPEVDPDDASYDARMMAWADRMARAVEADIVTATQVERAWRRGVNGAA